MWAAIGLFILFAAAFLVVLIYFSRVSVWIDAGFGNGRDFAQVRIKWFGIRLAVFQYPDPSGRFPSFVSMFKQKNGVGRKQEREQARRERQAAGWQKRLRKTWREGEAVRPFIAALRVKKLYWATSIGLEDAAATAFTAGVIWTLKANVLACLGGLGSRMDQPLIDVRPIYGAPAFRTHLRCMISVRLGQAILTACRIAKLRKGRHGGTCRNIPYRA